MNTKAAASVVAETPSDMILPLELVDKCIGERVFVVLRPGREFVGKLLGFDDYVNVVLEDVTEYEITNEGTRTKKLKQILLNGTTISLISSEVPDYL